MRVDKNLIDKSNEAWKTLSEWWDESVQDGDLFHKLLVFPGVLNLIGCRPGLRILDLGCGNGALSRKLSALGTDVVAVDVSETFIKKAIERSDGAIQYQVTDLTADSELQALSSCGQFDVVVCSMVLHDLPTLEPLLGALPSLISEEGCFIFSIPHPCFNMGSVNLDFFSDSPSISRASYVASEHLEMKSKPNQPVNQHCFHRSIAELFSLFFSKGMVLDGLEEPSVSNLDINLDAEDFAWKLLPEIPPVMLCRWVFKK